MFHKSFLKAIRGGKMGISGFFKDFMTKETKIINSEEISESKEVTSESSQTKKLKTSNSKEIQQINSYDLLTDFEDSQLKKELPEIYVGDTVKVGVKITEGNKERVQPYEGVVIAKRHGGLNQTITVRRIFQGIGVERIFMLHSPQVASLKVERRGKVRRAKLFYLRDRVGKATRVKQRFDR